MLKERGIWTRDTFHVWCLLAPSPGTAAKPCFAPTMSDDAREKTSVSKQGICVEVKTGKPEERLTRSPHTGQDSGGGSAEQRALEHLYLLGWWQWPPPTTNPCP